MEERTLQASLPGPGLSTGVESPAPLPGDSYRTTYSRNNFLQWERGREGNLGERELKGENKMVVAMHIDIVQVHSIST